MLRQFIRFVGVGGINTIVTYLLYLALLPFLAYGVAYSVVYIFGIGFAYWLNLKYVFQEKSTHKKIMFYPFVYLAQYLIGIIILFIAINIYNIPEEVAPILVVIISMPLTFILTKIILTE